MTRTNPNSRHSLSSSAPRAYQGHEFPSWHRGTTHVSTLDTLDAPDTLLDAALSRSVDIETQPTLALVGSSTFLDAKWPAGTNRRMVRNLSSFIPKFRDLRSVSSISIQLPPIDLALASYDDGIRHRKRRAPILPSLLTTPNLEFLSMGFVDPSSLEEDDIIGAQYSSGARVMDDLTFSRSPIGTLPRSAARLLGSPSIERSLTATGIDALLLQRSREPYSYAPEFPRDVPFVSIQGATRAWPAFVTDHAANKAFMAYLRSESQLPELVDTLYTRIAAARQASGLQLTVVRFPLEALGAYPKATHRFGVFLSEMGSRTTDALAVRSLGDCRPYLESRSEEVPSLIPGTDSLERPNLSGHPQYVDRINRILGAFSSLSGKQKVYALIALDRGFETAAVEKTTAPTNVLLDAVHTVLVEAAITGKDVYPMMRLIPENPFAPNLHKFGHQMLTRYESIAERYSTLS